MKEKVGKLLNKILNPNVFAIWGAIGIGVCILYKKEMPHTLYIIISDIVIGFGVIVCINEFIIKKRKKKKKE